MSDQNYHNIIKNITDAIREKDYKINMNNINIVDSYYKNEDHSDSDESSVLSDFEEEEEEKKTDVGQ